MAPNYNSVDAKSNITPCLFRYLLFITTSRNHLRGKNVLFDSFEMQFVVVYPKHYFLAVVKGFC
jgi:hypothetical protein